MKVGYGALLAEMKVGYGALLAEKTVRCVKEEDGISGSDLDGLD